MINMIRRKSRRYILVIVIAMTVVASPVYGIIYQNGNVSFIGAVVRQACTAEIRYHSQTGSEYTIELDECPWPDAEVLRVIVSTTQDIGRISSSVQSMTAIYSVSHVPGHYSLSIPGQALDSKEASVITVYYP